MNTIAKTATIEDNVTMGEGNIIHDYACIRKGTILGDNNEIGRFCRVGPFVTMQDSNILDFQVALGGDPQDLSYKGKKSFLTIGSHNTFREFVTAHRGSVKGSATRIGNHNYFMGYTHVAHDCVVGNHCVLSNYVGLAGHGVLEDYCIFGGHSGAHQFCRLGAHSMVGGMVKVNFDIPPFVIADGIPSRVRRVNSLGLERRGFSKEEIIDIKKFYGILYHPDTNFETALTKLEEKFIDHPHARQIIAFCKSSKRGVMRFYS